MCRIDTSKTIVVKTPRNRLFKNVPEQIALPNYKRMGRDNVVFMFCNLSHNESMSRTPPNTAPQYKDANNLKNQAQKNYQHKCIPMNKQQLSRMPRIKQKVMLLKSKTKQLPFMHSPTSWFRVIV